MINIQDTYLQAGHDNLFYIPKFHLKPGDKVGLIADNGSGKSVFMNQVFERKFPHSFDISFCKQQNDDETKKFSLNELVGTIHEQFDYIEFYKLIELFDLPTEIPLKEMSGGQEKKASLALSLCKSATLYLLDEPTNHLDLPSILWLEQYLKNSGKTLLVVSHDLSFIDKIVDSYWAIHDRVLKHYPGSYDRYLELREIEESTAQSEHNNRVIALKQEERYRERGVTARRKRNQKRVEKLQQLKKELSESLKNQRQASSFSSLMTDSMPAGQKIIELKNFTPCYFQEGQKNYLPPITTIMTRKDKIAIVGANGRGKSTLLRQLLEPSESVSLREQLKIAFLDQYRELDQNSTAYDLVSDYSDHIKIVIDGESQLIHPISYLRKFGIPAHKAQIKYGMLSGGEKMKVSLAKALAHPVDVLVLDEPTNDLDIEAVEELADMIGNFNGLVLMVTHDRNFINQCVSQIWYLNQKKLTIDLGFFDEELIEPMKETAKDQKKKNSASKESQQAGKNQYTSVESIMKKIEDKEVLLAELEAELLLPQYYSSGQEAKLEQLQQKKQGLELEIQKLYEKWNTID